MAVRTSRTWLRRARRRERDCRSSASRTPSARSAATAGENPIRHGDLSEHGNDGFPSRGLSGVQRRRGGESCANSYGSDCGSGDDGEDGEDEVADESPGCWEGLVEGEAVVTSGFQTDDRPDHNGLDPRCPTGTNVHAADAGRVTDIPNDSMAEGTFVEAGLPGSRGGGPAGQRRQHGRGHLRERSRRPVHASAAEGPAGSHGASGRRCRGGPTARRAQRHGAVVGSHLYYELMENGQHVDAVQGHDCE